MQNLKSMSDTKYLRDSFIELARAQLSLSNSTIKDFILDHTYLDGKRFSTKHHEYQDIIIKELEDPDVDFVIGKIAQAGVSEIVYRAILSYGFLTPNFYAAIVLPSIGQVTEVMRIRLGKIIKDSPKLNQMLDNKIDSASLKRFLNNAIFYALSGSKESKSTAITRPIRTIVGDELARVHIPTIKAMQARQKHQDHKSTILFSTPMYEDFDIDAEMKICGSLLKSLLKCTRCGKEFFPEYYDHVRLPGYSDPIDTLTINKIASKGLNLKEAYLECPKCNQKTEFGYPHTRWVNVSENANLPKRGMFIGPFDLPKYVQPADLIKDMVNNPERDEFEQQSLGKATKVGKHAVDTDKIVFERAGVPTSFNVFGLDFGKICWMTIGHPKPEGGVYIHTIIGIPVTEVREVAVAKAKEFRCIGGVVDMLPTMDTAVAISRAIPNTWVATYGRPKKPNPILYSLQEVEDEALGTLQKIVINIDPTFDKFNNRLSDKSITYRDSEDTELVKAHLKVMRKVKDEKNSVDDAVMYNWVKPERLSGVPAEDHIHHSSVYCMLAEMLPFSGGMNEGLFTIGTFNHYPSP